MSDTPASGTTTEGQNMLAFDFEQMPVRTILKGVSPWFVAADVCRVLEIANARDAVASLDEDEKATVGNPDGRPGQPGAKFFNIISESGLYALIFKSRKAEARRFRKWVTNEVLPALRKQGAYELASVRAGELEDLRLREMRDDLAKEVRDIEYRLQHVAEAALKDMPISRVNAQHKLARVQLDACRFLWDLAGAGAAVQVRPLLDDNADEDGDGDAD